MPKLKDLDYLVRRPTEVFLEVPYNAARTERPQVEALLRSARTSARSPTSSTVMTPSSWER